MAKRKKPPVLPNTVEELQALVLKLQEMLEQKVDRVRVLTEEIQSYNRENQMIVYNRQIRFKWYQACDAFHLGINQGWARMVTPLDAQQAFEPDDWARLAELEATFKQTLERFASLRESTTSQFVDAVSVDGDRAE